MLTGLCDPGLLRWCGHGGLDHTLSLPIAASALFTEALPRARTCRQPPRKEWPLLASERQIMLLKGGNTLAD